MAQPGDGTNATQPAYDPNQIGSQYQPTIWDKTGLGTWFPQKDPNTGQANPGGQAPDSSNWLSGLLNYPGETLDESGVPQAAGKALTTALLYLLGFGLVALALYAFAKGAGEGTVAKAIP